MQLALRSSGLSSYAYIYVATTDRVYQMSTPAFGTNPAKTKTYGYDSNCNCTSVNIANGNKQSAVPRLGWTARGGLPTSGIFAHDNNPRTIIFLFCPEEARLFCRKYHCPLQQGSGRVRCVYSMREASGSARDTRRMKHWQLLN